MKNTEALQILNALKKLDTYKNDSGDEVQYHFGSEAVFAIGKNIRKLTTIQSDLEQARVRLVKALLQPGEKEIPPNDPRLSGLIEEIASLYDQESDFKPHKFKAAALRAEINPLPPSVIAVIEPLITDETPPDTTAPAAGGGVPAAK